MRKIYLFSYLLAFLLMGIFFVLNACVDEKEEAFGSIFGIVTKEGTTEVMPAIVIELYLGNDRLLSTTTFSDGHYEFPDLKAGKYLLKISGKEYEEAEYSVIVESGRQARQDIEVKTRNLHMVIRTTNVTDQNGPNATLNGYVSYDNSSYIPTEVGFYYSINTDPLSGTKVIGDLEPVANTFSAQINDLTYGKYYVQAYGKNSRGISYGDIRTFEKTNYPIVRTDSATNILTETATLNGYIVSEGDPAYTERGFVYSKTYSTPTIDDPENVTIKVIVPGTNRDFSANVSSLSENSTYYVRAYAKHSKGCAYGKIILLIPQAKLPVVYTLDATNILSTSATFNGRIDDSGEPAYTERGFVYSSSYNNPTVNDPVSATTKIIVSGFGREFSANVDSLITGNIYHVRAYAKSAKGVSYGSVVSFKPQSTQYVILEDSHLMVQTTDLSSAATWTQAKALCENSTVGGYTDWRLPTLTEFRILYNHKSEIGGFNSRLYWSSYSGVTTSTSYSNSYFDMISNEQRGSDYPNSTYAVRAVRTIP